MVLEIVLARKTAHAIKGKLGTLLGQFGCLKLKQKKI